MPTWVLTTKPWKWCLIATCARNINWGRVPPWKEVVVSAEKDDQQVRSTEISVVTLDIKDAKLIPVLFGEQDILKTIQLLPGVSQNSEGNADFRQRRRYRSKPGAARRSAGVQCLALVGLLFRIQFRCFEGCKTLQRRHSGPIRRQNFLRTRYSYEKRQLKITGGIGRYRFDLLRLTVEAPLGFDTASEQGGSIILSGRRTYADLILKAADWTFR